MGATSGIGRSLAMELFPIGCRLILAGRNVNRLETLKAELQIKQSECKVIPQP